MPVVTASLLCSRCGDEVEPYGDGGMWGDALICADCEQRDLMPVAALVDAISEVLVDYGVGSGDSAECVREIWAAMAREGWVMVQANSVAERLQALRDEIADLQVQLDGRSNDD